ncbi:hypothetical protein GBF38_017377 [Nibea albiflora]|uniref:Uncharacterized protein n=1 Tax=Nibea albiflora TaxID=240163 RepID=A0ACB7EFC6_NIBAL|nr:hypothetical protein GBF38_017377 [Nibea albiflora]
MKQPHVLQRSRGERAAFETHRGVLSGMAAISSSGHGAATTRCSGARISQCGGGDGVCMQLSDERRVKTERLERNKQLPPKRPPAPVNHRIPRLVVAAARLREARREAASFGDLATVNGHCGRCNTQSIRII